MTTLHTTKMAERFISPEGLVSDQRSLAGSRIRTEEKVAVTEEEVRESCHVGKLVS